MSQDAEGDACSLFPFWQGNGEFAVLVGVLESDRAMLLAIYHYRCIVQGLMGDAVFDHTPKLLGIYVDAAEHQVYDDKVFIF